MRDKKVLLINPRSLAPFREEPLGLAYIAAYLEQKGIEVSIVDANALNLSPKKVLKKVDKCTPDIIGISTFMHNVVDAYEINNKIKNESKETKIIFGGQHATFLPEEVLGEGCGDIAVIGEGEKTMLEIVDALTEGRKKLSKILGICYKDKNNKFTIKTNPRPLIKNLDELPFPARHLLPMKKYLTTIHHPSGKRAASIITSRGCPYSCIFCASSAFWRGVVRFRSVSNVIEEIKHVIETYGINNFHFYDDCFLLNHKRVYEFCDTLLQEKLDIKWTCLARVDRINKDILEKMKSAGCMVIEIGIESGDQRILDLIKKDITLEQIDKAVNLIVEVGITPNFLYMRGNIGETPETVKKTYELAASHMAKALDHNLKYARLLISNATPIPGSEFFEVASKYGKIFAKTWLDYFKKSRISFLPKDLKKEDLKEDYTKIIKNLIVKHCKKRVTTRYK